LIMSIINGVHLSDICIGDLAKLKFNRGFMRIDEIVGNEVRERHDNGSVSWCDYTLIESIGNWSERK